MSSLDASPSAVTPGGAAPQRDAFAILVGAVTGTWLSPGELIGPAHGAVASFFGVVRDHTRGRAVLGLDYQAYPVMAEAVLAQLARAARAEHGEDLRIRVAHATGSLMPGEVALVIHVASAHRAAAFAACRLLIECIKQDLPVWKHQHYADGSSEWMQGS